jgi:hypothetical protein
MTGNEHLGATMRARPLHCQFSCYPLLRPVCTGGVVGTLHFDSTILWAVLHEAPTGVDARRYAGAVKDIRGQADNAFD